MKISVYNTHIHITLDPSSQDEFIAVQKLSGRYFDSAKQAWIIPIRLGLSDLLLEQKVFWQIEPVVRLKEEALYAAAQAEQVDIWSIPAYEGMATAILAHLRDVHFGNITVYNENHPAYREVQDDNANSRRKTRKVRSPKNATAESGNVCSGDEARRRAILDR